jgi:adenine specific DNA methylase Mod
VFGEKNFQGHIHWRRRHNQPNDKTKMIGLVTEHILVYAKNYEVLKENGVGKIPITATFSNPDNDPKGPWASKPWKTGSDQTGTRYTIISPQGKVFDEEWMGDFDTYNKYFSEGRIYFTNNGKGLPRKKYYKSEREEEGQCATNWWSHEMFGHNQGANDLLTSIFGKKNIFSNPKPIELLKGIINVSLKDNQSSIILDFFAGSGTTLHATMQLNEEDGGKRQCILVTNNENNICEEVTYERNKRVIEGYTTPKGEQVEGLKNNNLRYYKIDFVDRDSSVTAMKKLMVASTDLLCIKQNLYEEKDTFGSIILKPNIARYFNDGVKQMLIIYNTDAIESLVAEIEKMPEDTNIITYVFSTNNYPLNADFEDVADKVSLCALPAAINNAYRNVLPNKLTPKSDDHETETISGE